MFEKIIPVIVAIIALQFIIKYINNKKKNKQTPRNLDYKKKIDQFLRVSNFDEGIDNERIITEQIRSGLGKPELLLDIPDNMRDIRRGINIIIDGVTEGAKSKMSGRPTGGVKYNNPEKMFDEILDVINRHKIK